MLWLRKLHFWKWSMCDKWKFYFYVFKHKYNWLLRWVPKLPYMQIACKILLISILLFLIRMIIILSLIILFFIVILYLLKGLFCPNNIKIVFHKKSISLKGKVIN